MTSVFFGKGASASGGTSGGRSDAGRWARYAWKILSLPLRFLVSLFPRSPDVWVFGSWFGERFTDNPKYLYLHVCRHHPDVRAIWVARNAAVVREIRALGLEAYSSRSLMGLYSQIRAGVVVVSVGLHDVGDTLTCGASIVQTWHGIPLKHIGLDRFHERPAGLAGMVWSLRNRLLMEEWKSYQTVLATSAETQQRFASAFGVAVERVPVLGYPRNDVLADPLECVSLRGEVLHALGVPPGDSPSIIAYVPTHRDSGRGNLTLFPFADYREDELEAFLEETDSILVYKRHFFHSDSGHEDRRQSRILDGTQVLPDVQHLLACTDVLVTDLSSCFFDYLITDRPMVFVTEEIEEFVRNETGLYYSYDEVTPGPHAATFQAFIAALAESFSRPEAHGHRRTEVRNVFHQYCDAESSRRLYEYIRGPGPDGARIPAAGSSG